MIPKVYFKTFGCRTNLFDTQIMIKNLKNFELTEFEELADLVVVNSCTVTNGADSGVRSYLQRLRNEGKRVYLTGCGVLTRGEELFAQNLAFGVFGHSYKEQVDSLLLQKDRFSLKGDLEHVDSTVITEFVGKSRAFVKIQEGCDFACSYCIIPRVRGRARSLPLERICAQVEILAHNGFSEFVLTGTNMGSYGKDCKLNLAKLLKALSRIQGVRRLRLGSLEPSQIDEEFMELLGESFMARHLHIALQHTSPAMLKIMNRRNDAQGDLALFESLSMRGYALGTDFIIAHPGESEAVWQDAWRRFLAFPLTHLHAFIYSPREGTPSSRLKNDVAGHIAKERMRALQERVRENNRHFRSKAGVLQVLLENERESGRFQGLDQFFNRIEIHSEQPLAGKWIDVSEYQVESEINRAKI
ncbi:MAG: tRNA (N(6)-L-threonylcarbamoyladenosine(37)-C(2))-methylthiotransferase MtaB [Wolinella sp.]